MLTEKLSREAIRRQLGFRETLHSSVRGSRRGPEGPWLMTPWELKKLLEFIFVCEDKINVYYYWVYEWTQMSSFDLHIR